MKAAVKKARRDVSKYCSKLVKAYEKNGCYPENDPRRTAPLTPNDPATIARLATYLMFILGCE